MVVLSAWVVVVADEGGGGAGVDGDGGGGRFLVTGGDAGLGTGVTAVRDPVLAVVGVRLVLAGPPAVVVVSRPSGKAAEVLGLRAVEFVLTGALVVTVVAAGRRPASGEGGEPP